MRGCIFEIREFCVHDGPGARDTVFFKGCPLRCLWCHNPEGQAFAPELMLMQGRECMHCGNCRKVCPSPEHCINCGRCAAVCPTGRRQFAGVYVDSADVAKRLLRDSDFLTEAEGGVTFSGGEPLAQPDFLCAIADAISGMHRAIETCGYAPPEVYDAMLARMELVIQDIKIADPTKHRAFTGRDNAPILTNLARLQRSAVPFIIRVPLIPGATDDPQNLTAIAALLTGARPPLRVELLSANPAAPAKYPACGRKWELPTAEPASSDPLQPFLEAGLEVELLQM